MLDTLAAIHNRINHGRYLKQVSILHTPHRHILHVTQPYFMSELELLFYALCLLIFLRELVELTNSESPNLEFARKYFTLENEIVRNVNSVSAQGNDDPLS